MTQNWASANGEAGMHQDGTRPRIERHPLFDGLRVVDPIEGSQFTLLTPGPVEPTTCDTEQFYFPVDTAASIQTTAIETPYLVDVWIRDTNGNLVDQSANEEPASVEPGEYNLEISSAQMKLYLSVEGGIDVEPSEERMRISLTETRSVTVGVRSLHEQPAATITTTDDPEDLMRAISAFGSALKTTTCERSFPTLRGHPPLLERGPELDVPSALDIPDTGVRIEIPAELEYIFPIASLAYYLDATVEPGPEPRLVADGEAFSLTADGDFESTVERVLKQVFLMDCVTRTEGYYTVDLHEREVVEEQVDIDFGDLYEKSLAEQVQTYLSIPYGDIEEAVPRWKLTADVVTDPEHAETLPFLANDLAVIRCPDCADIESRSIHSESTSVADYFGDPSEASRSAATRSSDAVRSQSDSGGQPFEERVFRPPPAESIEQTYVGEGIPIGASKMTVESYRRRLEYEPEDSPRTSVIVVCNEEEMNDENVVSEIYGTREWLEFDITIKENLTTEEMRSVLETDADFLHYIGHVDEDGIRCKDGWLDTGDIKETNISAFLLNACKSYDQGEKIVTAGALGGIVTVTDLLNKTATKLGRTLARLLDSGFTLLSSLEILRRKSVVANHYLVVGDGNTQVCESRSGNPVIGLLSKTESDKLSLVLHYYPSNNYRLGAIANPYIKDDKQHFINSGYTQDFRVDTDTVREFIGLQNIPIQYNSTIFWSDDFAVDDL